MGYVLDPNKGKYNLEYYINLTRDISDLGVHSLAVNDMVELLTPRSATMIIS